jgi:hypothetical protein
MRAHTPFKLPNIRTQPHWHQLDAVARQQAQEGRGRGVRNACYCFTRSAFCLLKAIQYGVQSETSAVEQA